MNTKRIWTGVILAVALLAFRYPGVSATNEVDSWSPSTNGLQARLTLVERPKSHGTRWLVPYLELQNVRDLANQMEVQCDTRRLKVELVDADGKPIREGWSLPRSGPVPDLSAVVLPWDSSIRISLECKNWGIPKETAAMVSTDSGAWVIQESERGRVYLRATLTSEKPSAPPYWKAWYGKLQTPLVKIDWK
jgi:hypothetical protein